MSSSLPCNIPVVLEYLAKNLFTKLQPSSADIEALADGIPLPPLDFKILDVGAGYGKWGFLIRDLLDAMMFQHFNKADWAIHLTGVEPFAKYITPLQTMIYDEIIHADILDCVDDLGEFDVAIFGDVIEHFEKDQGHQVLRKLLEHTDNLIISTPNGFIPQGAWAGNDKETHRSGWTLEDFAEYSILQHRLVEDTLLADFVEKPTSLLVLWIGNKS